MDNREGKIKEYFTVLKKHNLFGPAYLFVGDNLNFVIELSRLIICSRSSSSCGECDDCRLSMRMSHPDIMVIDNGKKTIRIDDIRTIQEFLSRRPFQAAKKIAIINNAHMFTQDAANSFLKTTEEPPDNSIIILISPRPDLIIPTIRSRCRKIYMPRSETVPAGGVAAELRDFLTGGDIGFSERRKLAEFIEGVIVVLRDYLMFKIYGDKSRLVYRDGFDIISEMDFSLEEVTLRIDNLLKVYSGWENINLNLAANLLKLTFPRVKAGFSKNRLGS